MADLLTLVGGKGRSQIGHTCGLANAAFCDTFSTIASPRGRGGDLNKNRWAVGRFTPYPGIVFPSNPNYTRILPIPAGIQEGFANTTAYPPNDMLVSNIGAHRGQLMTSIAVQNYGSGSMMIRQPFDFTSRTGTILFYVDAATPTNLGHYIQFSLTADPVPCPTFVIADNDETGPVPRHGLILPFRDAQSGQPAGTRVNIADASVYNTYARTALTPSTVLTGSSAPATLAGSLNRIEIRVSTSLVSVYMSDYFDGSTYPNSSRLVWEDSISLPFSIGYVHIAVRNHACVKYIWPVTTGIYYWDNVAFDGSALAVPRAYEVPDNTTTASITDDATEGAITVQNLGYRVSDGSVISEGVWSPSSNISPLTFTGSVDLTGASSAQMTLNLWVLTGGTPTISTSSGLRYKFNGGTWRTRTFTSDEVSAVNGAGSGGALGLLIDLTLADLQSGTNTIDFSTVNIPQNFYPMICNIDLLVHT